MRHALAILILAFSMSIGANRLCAETRNIVALGVTPTVADPEWVDLPAEFRWRRRIRPSWNALYVREVGMCQCPTRV